MLAHVDCGEVRVSSVKLHGGSGLRHVWRACVRDLIGQILEAVGVVDNFVVIFNLEFEGRYDVRLGQVIMDEIVDRLA